MNKALFARYLVILGGQVFMAEMSSDAETASDSSENLRPIPILSFTANSELTSDGTGYHRVLPAIVLSSDMSESNTYTLAQARLLDIIQMQAGGHSDSYLLSHAQLFSTTPAIGGYEIKLYGDGAANTPTVESLNDNVRTYSYVTSQCDSTHTINAVGNVEITDYIKGHLCAFKYEHMNGYANSQHYSDATLYSYRLTPLCAISENETYSDAISRVIDAIDMMGEISSTSDSATSCTSIPVIDINGVGESFVNGISTARVFLLGGMDAYGDILFDTSCHIGLYDAVPTLSMENSNSATSAYLHLWYLPIQKEANLYIRQAYDVIKNNTNLEVK